MDEKDFDRYDIAKEIRNFEISLFWKRSNYFLVLNTAIATGVFLKINEPSLSLFLSIFGLIVSILWINVNLGSKYWQDRWEAKLAKIETEIDPTLDLFSVSESIRYSEVKESIGYLNPDSSLFRKLVNRLILIKPSVSRNMIALSFLFSIFWIFLMFRSILSGGYMEVIYSCISSFLSGTFMQNFMPNFISEFLAVLLALFLTVIYDRRRTSKDRIANSKEFIKLLVLEIEKNLSLIKQMLEFAESTPAIVPTFQLSTINKDSVWSSLLDRSTLDREIYNKVASSYFEYVLINRTSDILFTSQSGNANQLLGNIVKLCKAEKTKTEALLEILKKL